MADIRIHREHQLGLAKARKVAWAWANYQCFCSFFYITT